MSRKPHLLLLLAASFALSAGSYVIEQTVRWTEPLQGFLSGLFHVPIFGVLWLFCGLLPGLVIYVIYRWRKWRRFRSTLILLPGLVAAAVAFCGLVWVPPTAAHRFKRSTHIDLPTSATDIRAHCSGGGFADYDDIYYFRCSADDTKRLIQALELKSDEGFSDNNRLTRSPFPSWPDPSSWEGGALYSGESGNGHWYYLLRTDAAAEQVYFNVGCY